MMLKVIDILKKILYQKEEEEKIQQQEQLEYELEMDQRYYELQVEDEKRHQKWLKEYREG